MADEQKRDDRGPVVQTPSTAIRAAIDGAVGGRGKGRDGRVLFAVGGEPAPPPVSRMVPPGVREPEAPAVFDKSEPLPGETPLEKSLRERLSSEDEVIRLAFDKNPDNYAYQTIYQAKPLFIPEWLLKRMAHRDDLVSAIIKTRCNQIRSFGQPRIDRHAVGFAIKIRDEIAQDLDEKQKEEILDRIKRAKKLLMTCGKTDGYKKNEQQSFADFLTLITQSALIVGRVAIEKVHGKKIEALASLGMGVGGKAHSFRAVDAATIFPATSQQKQARALRERALRQLARLKGKQVGELGTKLDLQKWADGEYSYVQVIEGQPRSVFTDEEMLNIILDPVPDVEMMGHPIAPLDTVIAAVTTHISITQHNKAYFASGRASKGMLVIKSEDADQDTLKAIQAHMVANVNGAYNAWRMPTFAVGPKDEVQWVPIDQSGQRDAEFQYLGDSVMRIILAAFQISPEELTGYSYLGRGTAAQTLSEGSSEYKLEAHRDLGIRPLIARIETIVNEELLEVVDPGLKEFAVFQMLGLDADDAQKEATRLEQDMGLHMTQSEILQRVDKDPLPRELGGEVLLNPQWHQLVVNKFVTVGWVREYLLGYEGAATDPRYDYIADPMYFQQQQLLMGQQQAEQQAQMAAQGGGPGGQPGAGGEQPPPEEGHADALQQSFKDGAAEMSKSERQMTPAQRSALSRQRRIVSEFKKGFRADADQAKKEIVASVEDLLR